MPIDAGRSDGWQEEMSLYAARYEYAVSVLALDHFFREVVEGNVPLTGDDPTEPWWNRQIVTERVNRYSENWCLLFEGLAHIRERIEEQGIHHDLVAIDENLNFVYTDGRRGTEFKMKWVPVRVR